MNRRRFLIGNSKLAIGVSLIPTAAFSIYDKVNQVIFSARDRLGVKPFYYSWDDGKFEICSQLAPFSNKGKISKEAIAIYLQTGYIASPYSVYDNIYNNIDDNIDDV